MTLFTVSMLGFVILLLMNITRAVVAESREQGNCTGATQDRAAARAMVATIGR